MRIKRGTIARFITRQQWRNEYGTSVRPDFAPLALDPPVLFRRVAPFRLFRPLVLVDGWTFPVLLTSRRNRRSTLLTSPFILPPCFQGEFVFFFPLGLKNPGIFKRNSAP